MNFEKQQLCGECGWEGSLHTPTCSSRSSKLEAHKALSLYLEKLHSGEDVELEIDFDELIRAEHQLEEQCEGLFLDRGDRDRHFESFRQISEEEIIPVFKEMLQRIQRETKAFHEWEDTGIVLRLLQALEDGNLGEEVRVIDRFSFRDIMPYLVIKMRGAAGAAAPGKVRIGKNYEPTAKRVWQAFAFYDGRSPHLDTLDHELIHTFQFKSRRDKILRNFTLGTLLDLSPACLVGGLEKVLSFPGVLLFRDKTLLLESHADRAAANISSSLRHFLEDLQVGYGKMNLDKLIGVTVAIDRLRACGLNDKELADLVANTRWDGNKKEWTSLELAVQNQCDALGLELEDLDNLVMADKYERRIESLKAQIIAIEELKKLILSRAR